MFLKLNVENRAFQRLSELGITPPLLASGEIEGVGFIIQEYVEGIHPSAAWFKDHVLEVAKIFKLYHADETLKAILIQHATEMQEDTLIQLKTIEKELASVQWFALKEDSFTRSYQQFKDLTEDLPKVSLVPIHADPNIKNFLLQGDKMYMLDWDDIILSDPLRDMGLFVYWYLPENQWNDFFKVQNMSLDAETSKRIYWWVSARSLSIGLWFAKRDQLIEAKEYLKNFYAAIDEKSNPHAFFS